MLTGKQIGDYKLLEELGRGSFGCVYKCQNMVDQSYHAIKIIQFQSLSNSEGIVGELLKDEISVLAKIESPNVLRLEHYFQSKSNCYILMEYCNGGDLENYWEKQGKKIEEQKVIDIIVQILNGLSELHKLNVIHRDIKLANILMHNDLIKIADLGFCKQLQYQCMEVSLCLGTPGTMAPEVARFDSYGLQSDIFSIGCIFYQLLFGELPFEYINTQQYLEAIQQQNINFNKNGVVIQEEIKDIIIKMLKENPKERLTFPQLYQYPLFKRIQKMSQASQIALKSVSKQETAIFYKDIYENNRDVQIQQKGMNTLKQNGDIFKTQTENQGEQVQYVDNLQKVNTVIHNQQEQENVSKLAYEMRATHYLSPNQQPYNSTLQQLQESEQIFKTVRNQNDSHQLLNNQQNTYLVQSFRFIYDALQYCDRTYLEIDQIQFKNQSQSWIGKFMIQKRLRVESKNYFQTLQQYPYLNELSQMQQDFETYIQNQTFNKLLEQIKSDPQLQTSLRQEYIQELKEEPTGTFQLYYCQALMELYAQIKTEINKETENKKKKVLVICLLHIQRCMHFQDLSTYKIDFQEEFINVKTINLIDIIKKVQY
ncbi:unnamed protein product [Paramecium sonneborni]|uniref:Protein kinase domain-containing protein n=1 Tax=Paramecium sonneborni TaxID=65129 RepID=A0A8S1K5R7_9CILI|nr:unnamed protein product [Paramecium sonneborni]